MTHDEYIKGVAETYGTCAEVTLDMASVFPDLTRVRGHYHCPAWGKREHWWLATLDGSIVDPTAAQFPSKGIGTYEPWVEGATEPTGICMNCGDYVYEGAYFCSDSCQAIVMADFN